MNRLIFGVAVVVTTVLAGPLLEAKQAQEVRPAPQGANASDVRKAESDALRRGGLKAAAAVTGNYIGRVSADPENNAESINQLVDWHDLIVVGRMLANRSHLTADGRDIVTDYQVLVEQVLKGPRVKQITVSVAGGRVGFEDGSTATITSTMPPPLSGERYVLFLVPSFYPAGEQQRNAAEGREFYALQHLSLGVFVLSGDQRGVVPRARIRHPLRKAFDGMAEDDFIALIKRKLGGK